MAKPYIAEIQTAHWTSDEIRHAFQQDGFELRDWPLTAHLEKHIPADMAFYSPDFTKLFGLQYKTLYRNGEDFWPLDHDQHDSLRQNQWIFYCCSELKSVTEHRLALHFARFYKPRFAYRERITTDPLFKGGQVYSRWGLFYRALKECRSGARVKSPEQLRDLLPKIDGAARTRETNQMIEFFLPNFDKRLIFTDRQF